MTMARWKSFRLMVVAALGIVIALAPYGTLVAQGVAKGPMRTITAKQLVYDMKIGWNLGNTLDAPDGETTWGNPMTTQAMIDALKAKGFKTVRIPVTWNKHMGGAPNYTVDGAWMDRVETIANYVLRDSMYAIINTHHDEWVTLTASNQAAVAERIGKLWTQIANRFKDYSDYLVFETFNEPRQSVNEWNGGTPEARAILNAYHQTAVNAIRATGGNNATRFIMICGHAATPTTECVSGIVIPNNNDPRCIVSLHTYYPQEFSFPENSSAASWGSSTDQANVIRELDREKNDVSTKGGGTAVIGEWASAHKNNLSARVAHAEFYAREARSRGMLPVWWDNGANDFGILNRKSNPPSWTWPTIADALVRGASNATPVLPAVSKPAASMSAALALRAGVITYALSACAPVTLRLVSMRGEVIATLVQTVQPAGKYSIAVPDRAAAAGSYLLELRYGATCVSKRIAQLR